jgi:hypothetical protein
MFDEIWENWATLSVSRINFLRGVCEVFIITSFAFRVPSWDELKCLSTSLMAFASSAHHIAEEKLNFFFPDFMLLTVTS